MLGVKKMRKIYFVLILLILLTVSCKKEFENAKHHKIIVVTTLFPLYDFAKNVGGNRVEVLLLLPPGVEAHSFEPKPEDILKINKSQIFIYTGKDMEPWAEKVIESIDNKSIVVVDASSNIEEMEHKEEDDEHGHKKDPHIWLDFDNAKKIVDNILAGFIKVDGGNAEFYIKNAENYKKILTDLDENYKNSLKNCRTKYLFHAGHFAFGYLAKRYNLKYISAYPGVSPDEEPKPVRIAKIIKEIRENKAHHIFYEEFMSPKIAEVIKRETGTELIKINAGHNVSKEEFERGITFVEIMKKNLENLKQGLQCQ